MIYLDNAATTHMLPCVQEAVHPWLSGVKFGNASTLHSVGREARAAVEQARCNVANLINAEPNEIIFTSGGTESDITAILGIVPYLKVLEKRKIIVSAIEHHAILKLQSYLKLLDIEMEIAPVKRSGEIDYDWLFSKVANDDIGLVSIMLANNEIGVVQELALISEFCHNHECLVHTDAVQAVGHMAVDVRNLGVDMLSISGHKFGAMQGIGALYVKSDIRPYIYPMIVGGGQERGLRSGTENVAGIVSLGEAACHMTKHLDQYIAMYHDLRDQFMMAMEKENCNFVSCTNQNGEAEYLPNIVSLTFCGVEAEALLQLMNADGVCISAASACSAGSLEPSHVLKAIGMSDDEARATIRISLGVNNTNAEMEQAAQLLSKNASRIKKMYQ